MLRFDRFPRWRQGEIRELVDAYVAMTTTQEPGRQRSSDEALWTLWYLAGERYAPDLVEELILAVGDSGA
jgi:response regulator RpfG family c-di-GMP phosphodiesterase